MGRLNPWASEQLKDEFLVQAAKPSPQLFSLKIWESRGKR